MVVYIDTSVLVAMFTGERKSLAIRDWLKTSKPELISAYWCITEVASALGQKQRTGSMDHVEAEESWDLFEQLAVGDLQLIPVEFADFHGSADLMQDGASGLRAGDALHLACARRLKIKTIATLDETMARAARQIGIQPVPQLLDTPPE